MNSVVITRITNPRLKTRFDEKGNLTITTIQFDCLVPSSKTAEILRVLEAPASATFTQLQAHFLAEAEEADVEKV